MKVIILVGESASGKSSIEKELIKSYGLKKIVPYTTRPMREGEVDGVDYHIITVPEFGEKVARGEFAEYSQFNNWFYGTLGADYAGNKVATLNPGAMRKVQKMFNSDITDVGIITIYINVPRRDRLIKILSRGDDIEEAYRRNVSDVGQFNEIECEVDYVIDNPGYERTPKELADVIMEEIVK